MNNQLSMRQLLEYQADQIEIVLYSHKIAGRVTGGTVTPHWVRFQVVLPATTTPERVLRLQGAIAHHLGAECRVQSHDGQLVIEIARHKRQAVTLSQIAGNLPAASRLAALLGICLSDGRPLLLRLTSPDVAHVLVSGTTGCGKTALMRSIIASLAWYNESGIQLYIVDPVGNYSDLVWLPHLPLHSITSDLGDAADVVGMLVARIESRDESEPHVLLVIDELADLVMTGGQPILDGLTRLTQRGRGAGIHVLAGTQKPTAQAIGGLVKSNFPTRIVGRVVSAEDARVASGMPGTGAERLRGRGDFILCLGDQTRFQSVLVDTEFLYRLRSRIRRGGYAGAGDGDPLAEYRASVKESLRVLPGGRQDEQDAQHIINTPGWIERWWDPARCRVIYGAGTAIGGLLNPPEKNEGSGHHRIKRVEAKIIQILSSTITSTTYTGDS